MLIAGRTNCYSPLLFLSPPPLADSSACWETHRESYNFAWRGNKEGCSASEIKNVVGKHSWTCIRWSPAAIMLSFHGHNKSLEGEGLLSRLSIDWSSGISINFTIGRLDSVDLFCFTEQINEIPAYYSTLMDHKLKKFKMITQHW